MKKIIFQLINILNQIIINFFFKDIENLKKNTWIIENLTIEAMIKRPHHLIELFKSCGLPPFKPNQDLTFQQLLNMNLQDHKKKVEEISRKAEKEWNLERKLLEVYDNFKEIKLDLKSYK